MGGGLAVPSGSHFQQRWGPWAYWAAPQTRPIAQERGPKCHLAASLCGLLPWLGCDSLHLRFLPQRARGTDPVQVLEGRGVSQALRAVWGEMRSLEAVAFAVTAFCGKPHPVWHCSGP